MNKSAFVMGVLTLAVGLGARAGGPCPNNNFKACARVLDQSNKADKGKPFIETFDDICGANSKFKCIKVTVMGDPKQAEKDVKEDHPKARLYFAQQEDGQYIYVFDKK